MATMNQYAPERRHTLERRGSMEASLPSGTDRSSRDRVSSTEREHTHRMGALDWIAMTLLIIGGLNWGMIGLVNYDLVGTLFGDGTSITRAVYVLVGLSALYSIYTASKLSRSRR